MIDQTQKPWWLEVWKTLSFQRVVLFLFAAFALTTAKYGWDHRETVVPGLLGNSMGIIAVAVGVSLVALALLAGWGITFVEAKSERMSTYLHEQVHDLRNINFNQELKFREVDQKLSDIARREAECQMRLRLMARSMRAAGVSVPVFADDDDLGARR